MLYNSTYLQTEFQKLVATLAKLQGKPKAGLIEVVEGEVDFLANKVRQLSQHRKLRISSIKRKMQNLTEECNQIVLSAENFGYEIEKSLKQSERQCFKRIQRLQRDRLQKQIEIKTVIDQQILAIVQQSSMTNQIFSHFQQQKLSIQNTNLQIELWFKEMQTQEKMKQQSELNNVIRYGNSNIFKQKTEKIISFKERTSKIFKSLEQRLQKMKRQRQRWERQTLQQIQEIIENLMIRRY